MATNIKQKLRGMGATLSIVFKFHLQLAEACGGFHGDVEVRFDSQDALNLATGTCIAA